MVLARLGESETGLSLEQLSQEVAAREADAPATDVPAEAASEVYLTLYHVHVPKLAEAELVEYDRASDVVALAAHARPLDERVGQLSVG